MSMQLQLIPVMLMHGKVKAVLIPKERAIDIDDEIDFKIAEMLAKEKQDGEYA